MLYHFSENPHIITFSPRPSKTSAKPVVWAIDQEHSIYYYFPRDCPRVIYWKADYTNENDKNQFFFGSSADKIITVESRWLERIRQTKLYVYSFSADSFEMFDENAGYYVSDQEVSPTKVEPVGILLEKLLSESIELRFTPDLYPIRDMVISSTLGFSIIRFGNAISASKS
ncbi:hypothetical protein KHA94_17425 [Bacillus sp. FJAT-49705]|uniref:DUF4433 domain-containing protein n=1 Tax=Cytobacillus citreus TaxID=2833586 RepID=A0ABS5NVU9_9BACI|nr:DUF6886 family protein [Cytobacillus citreus]MBS4191951.1 hypothetical protein [Cytobacillus citreus]